MKHNGWAPERVCNGEDRVRVRVEGGVWRKMGFSVVFQQVGSAGGLLECCAPCLIPCHVQLEVQAASSVTKAPLWRQQGTKGGVGRAGG